MYTSGVIYKAQIFLAKDLVGGCVMLVRRHHFRRHRPAPHFHHVQVQVVVRQQAGLGRPAAVGVPVPVLRRH